MFASEEGASKPIHRLKLRLSNASIQIFFESIAQRVGPLSRLTTRRLLAQSQRSNNLKIPILITPIPRKIPPVAKMTVGQFTLRINNHYKDRGQYKADATLMGSRCKKRRPQLPCEERHDQCHTSLCKLKGHQNGKSAPVRTDKIQQKMKVHGRAQPGWFVLRVPRSP